MMALLPECSNDFHNVTIISIDQQVKKRSNNKSKQILHRLSTGAFGTIFDVLYKIQWLRNDLDF